MSSSQEHESEEADRRRFAEIKQLLTQLASFDDDEDDWWDDEVPVAVIKAPHLTEIEAELMDDDNIVQAEEEIASSELSRQEKEAVVAAVIEMKEESPPKQKRKNKKRGGGGILHSPSGRVTTKVARFALGKKVLTMGRAPNRRLRKKKSAETLGNRAERVTRHGLDEPELRLAHLTSRSVTTLATTNTWKTDGGLWLETRRVGSNLSHGRLAISSFDRTRF
ncbi:unnamed protein product [Linum trigynum]